MKFLSERNIYGYCRLRKQENPYGPRYIKLLFHIEDMLNDNDNIIEIFQDIDGAKMDYLKSITWKTEDILVFEDFGDLGDTADEIYENYKWLVNTKVDAIFYEMPRLNTFQADDEETNNKIVKAILSTLLNLSTIASKIDFEASLSGRPKNKIDFSSDLFKQNYQKWKRKEITAKEFRNLLSLTHTVFYERIKEYEKIKEI